MANKCALEIVKSAKGKLTEAQAEELLNNIESLARRRVRTGKSKSATAIVEATEDLIKQEQVVRAHNDKVRLLQHIKDKEMIAHVDQFYDGDLIRGIQSLMENVTGTQRGMGRNIDTLTKEYTNRFTQRLRLRMEQDGVLKMWQSGDIDLEIRQELYNLDSPEPKPGGVSKNEDALKIAKHLRETGNEILAGLNDRGALIGRLEGYSHNQKWDRVAMRMGGRTLGEKGLTETEAMEKFVEFARDKIDLELTIHNGTDPDEFLRHFWRNEMSSLHGKVETSTGTGPRQGPLASRLAASRVLHPKDAAAAHAFAKEFGEPKLHDGVETQYQSLARSMALMERMGPNPDKAIEDLIMHYRERLRKENRVDLADQLSPGRAGYAKIRDMFEQANGSALIPEDIKLSNFSAVVKALSRMARLGGAAITSITDLMFTNNALANRGLGAFEAMGQQIRAMAEIMGDKGARAAMKSVAVAMDSFNGHAQMRFDSGLTTRGKMSWLERKFFALTLLPKITDFSKAAAVNSLATLTGEFSGKAFGDLEPDFRSMLQRYSISENEWNFLRSRAGVVTDHSFIETDAIDWVVDHKAVLPDQINDVDASILKEYGFKDTKANRRKATERIRGKLASMYTEFADIAVPTPGAREQRILRFGTRPGTNLGVVVEFLTMLKSFPLTVMTKPLAENYRMRGGEQGFKNFVASGSGPLAVIRLAVLTSIMGYTSGVIKDWLKGKDRKKFFDKNGKPRVSTFLDAMQRGGGAGILGDFTLSEYDRSYRSFSQALMGPVLGQMDPIMDIATRARKGEEFSTQGARLILDNTPGANLFWIRPAIDQLFWYETLDNLSPGWRERHDKDVMEKSGQGPAGIFPFFPGKGQ